MEAVKKPRNVAIFIYENVEILDFTGPFEVFLVASKKGTDFNVYTVAEKEQPVLSLGNLSINPRYSIENCPIPDILIVPGGWGSRTEMNNELITNWIKEISKTTELVLSVCTGALILANSDLLDGLRVTTNRLAMDELREVIPDSSEIVEEVRYVDNGNVILSAGVSAGIDVSLYIIEKLLGEKRALESARLMEYEWDRHNDS